MSSINYAYFFKILNIIKVTDGDTVKVEIDQGFSNRKITSIRMLGYDAPETYRPKCKEEREGGYRVKEYLVEKIKNCLISGPLYVHTEKHGKYGGRYLGTLYHKYEGEFFNINDEVRIFMETNNLTKEELRAKGMKGKKTK